MSVPMLLTPMEPQSPDEHMQNVIIIVIIITGKPLGYFIYLYSTRRGKWSSVTSSVICRRL